MISILTRALMLLSVLFYPVQALAHGKKSPDTYIINANIYTGDDKNPKAESVYISKGKISYVGPFSEDFNNYAENVIDLKGATLFPGFTDAHVHLKGIGYREKTLNLQNIDSLAETIAKVRQFVKTTAPGEWVIGRGWIEKVWPEKRFPNIHDLDSFTADRPVSLGRADGHALLVNSVALKLAGIDRNTPDPEGGAIRKDADGNPTGILVDNAMNLVKKLLPANTLKSDKDAFRLALKRNVALGWTQTQNAGGSYDDVKLLQEIKAEGNLSHRLYYAVSSGAPAAQMLSQGPVVDHDHMLNVGGIKLYADGALGSRGAALIEKYSDYDTKGLLLTSREKALPILIEALKKGVQIEMHAIGDRANRLVLDWYEEAMKAVPENERKIKNPRWRVEHAQNIQPGDQQRYKDLGIIPSMQPSHAIGDLHFAPSRLGKDRLANAYVWANMIKLGLMPPAGSDAPVEIGDPRIEFYAAVARKDLNGFSNEDWHAEQAVSRTDALKMLTLWPAYAVFQENLRGSIIVGKLADFTIFDKDLMTIPEDQIMSSEVIMTIVGGTVVYKK